MSAPPKTVLTASAEEAERQSVRADGTVRRSLYWELTKEGLA